MGELVYFEIYTYDDKRYIIILNKDDLNDFYNAEEEFGDECYEAKEILCDLIKDKVCIIPDDIESLSEISEDKLNIIDISNN